MSADLLEVIADLGAEERAVLLVLARRLLAGQAAYGRLDLAKDARDWRKEAAEEAADLAIYTAIGIVADDLRRLKEGQLGHCLDHLPVPP
jgi:hypothetical protein